MINKYNLKDIREYEEKTRESILDYFEDLKVDKVLSLVSLGNGKCNLSEAEEILDYFLKYEGTFFDAIIEIKKALFGEKSLSDNEEEQEELIETTHYKNLTDLYMHFCEQLMDAGLTYSEFWSMNTVEMYGIFKHMQIKKINEYNSMLQIIHTGAALNSLAIVGKLPKQPPKIEIPLDDEYEDLSPAEKKLLMGLKAFAAVQRQKEKDRKEALNNGQ